MSDQHEVASLAPRQSAPQKMRAKFPWKAYAQLVRLPNIFTAMADIALGGAAAIATGTPWSRWPAFVAVLVASSCLYAAGMVWNDFFDIEQDRRERPFRPLPSGQVSRRAGAIIGLILLLVGVALAMAVGMTSVVLAVLLVLAIMLYDAWLKRTPAGPMAMGSCRFLNVLLGFSLAGDTLLWSGRIYVALAVGLYIVGVTWFARTEALQSNRSALGGAAGVMLAALILALPVPVWIGGETSSVLFPYLLVALGFLVGLPISRAIRQPIPGRVQPAVKIALVGLVVLDAVLASVFVGVAGLALLVLLVPVLYLGRWIYST
jgi:4-hydroxybenzoate polyprenyltransferase